MFVDAISPADPILDTHLQAIELLRDPSHVRDYRVSEWCAALGRSGFTIDRVGMHRLRMDFATWTARMRTTPTHVDAIRSLQAGASVEVRSALAVEDDGSFLLDIACFEMAA